MARLQLPLAGVSCEPFASRCSACASVCVYVCVQCSGGGSEVSGHRSVVAWAQVAGFGSWQGEVRAGPRVRARRASRVLLMPRFHPLIFTADIGMG